jgi:hypothetical protein
VRRKVPRGARSARGLAAVGGLVPVDEGDGSRSDQQRGRKDRETAEGNHDAGEDATKNNERNGFGVHISCPSWGDVDRDVAGREKRLDDQGGDGGNETQGQEIANTRQKKTAAPASRDIAARGSTQTLMDPDVLNNIAPVQVGIRSLFSTILLAKHIVVIVGSVNILQTSPSPMII